MMLTQPELRPQHQGFEIGRGIRLSPIAASDAAALACLVQQNIDHFQAFLPAVVQMSTVEEAARHLDMRIQAAAEGEMLEWHIFEHQVLCGAVRVKDIDQTDRSAALGYFIGERFQGKGIVTLSVAAVIEYCFYHLELNRIELRCAAANLASMRVADRLGFSREGVLRQAECLDGAFVDNHVYGLLRSDSQGANK
jgi:ribosomal-protein-serine acetyltransferase